MHALTPPLPRTPHTGRTSSLLLSSRMASWSTTLADSCAVTMAAAAASSKSGTCATTCSSRSACGATAQAVHVGCCGTHCCCREAHSPVWTAEQHTCECCLSASAAICSCAAAVCVGSAWRREQLAAPASVREPRVRSCEPRCAPHRWPAITALTSECVAQRCGGRRTHLLRAALHEHADGPPEDEQRVIGPLLEHLRADGLQLLGVALARIVAHERQHLVG